jgi:hypothetical protein
VPEENPFKKNLDKKALPTRPMAIGALLHDAHNLNRSCSYLFV